MESLVRQQPLRNSHTFPTAQTDGEKDRYEMGRYKRAKESVSVFGSSGVPNPDGATNFLDEVELTGISLH